MALIDRVRNQTAVYWEYTGPDGFGGGLYEDAVELQVYWMEKVQEFTDSETGDATISEAVVYPGVDLVPLSYLKWGTLDDLDSAAPLNDPIAEDKVYQLRGWEKIPDMSGTQFVRKAMLK